MFAKSSILLCNIVTVDKLLKEQVIAAHTSCFPTQTQQNN